MMLNVATFIDSNYLFKKRLIISVESNSIQFGRNTTLFLLYDYRDNFKYTMIFNLFHCVGNTTIIASVILKCASNVTCTLMYNQEE